VTGGDGGQVRADAAGSPVTGSVAAGPGADRPSLSVIIACLDAAGTLGTQLEALARQSCPVGWELLLCDNGSTDGSVALARTYRGRIPGLRVIDASGRRGAGPARNYGVDQALGEWVAFCDADDEVAPDWLATMCRALAEHRFVAGRFESQRLNGARVLRSRPLQQQGELQSSEIGARLPHAGGGNMGMHRADFLAVGGFDPKIRWLEDTDFSWRAQLSGVPLVFRPEVVVHVRLRQTFRSMYVQGREYGLAHALLEAKYGPPPVPSASAVNGPPAATAAPRRGIRPAVSWFMDHVVGGRLAWRVGWVVGHRSHRPSTGSTGSTGSMTVGSYTPSSTPQP
jgi:cellulose synthase/poly-beta-1,6-N-acetylglucosamine synthase-like glycosyltransferase